MRIRKSPNGLHSKESVLIAVFVAFSFLVCGKFATAQLTALTAPYVGQKVDVVASYIALTCSVVPPVAKSELFVSEGYLNSPTLSRHHLLDVAGPADIKDNGLEVGENKDVHVTSAKDVMVGGVNQAAFDYYKLDNKNLSNVLVRERLFTSNIPGGIFAEGTDLKLGYVHGIEIPVTVSLSTTPGGGPGLLTISYRTGPNTWTHHTFDTRGPPQAGAFLPMVDLELNTTIVAGKKNTTGGIVGMGYWVCANNQCPRPLPYIFEFDFSFNPANFVVKPMSTKDWPQARANIGVGMGSMTYTSNNADVSRGFKKGGQWSTAPMIISKGLHVDTIDHNGFTFTGISTWNSKNDKLFTGYLHLNDIPLNQPLIISSIPSASTEYFGDTFVDMPPVGSNGSGYFAGITRKEYLGMGWYNVSLDVFRINNWTRTGSVSVRSWKKQRVTVIKPNLRGYNW